MRTLLWVCLLVTLSVGRRRPSACTQKPAQKPAAPAPARRSLLHRPATQKPAPQAAQGELVLQGDTTPRPALPTYFGDTGLWFVLTAETLPSGKLSFSVYRANFDRHQGLTDVGEFGITGAVGLGDRLNFSDRGELDASSETSGLIFVPSDPEFGGVANEFPFNRDHWSKTLGEPIVIGAKFGLLSQSRGNGMALAPRVMLKFPSGGATAASTKAFAGDLRSGRQR